MKKSVTCTTATLLFSGRTILPQEELTASETDLQPMTIVLVDPVVLDLDEDVPVVNVDLGNPKHVM